jgi:alpha-N-acetylglucosaminidase
VPQGINMPLAFVGQEYVWKEVFKGYGLTLDDQHDFYSGPAFLPWFRMGNMKGFGGPLTEDWMDKRRDLNIKMLARMRGLGMTPALSAFAGHVPANFTKYVPTANVTRSPNWANFNLGGATELFADVFMVEPTDPLFVEIGNKFIALQEKIYGTDHVYQCDTYNEMNPPTDDPSYLETSSKNVYAAMSKADPDAIWLMQGWLFQHADFWKPPQITAYLGGVAKQKMWLLDLFGDSNPIWPSECWPTSHVLCRTSLARSPLVLTRVTAVIHLDHMALMCVFVISGCRDGEFSWPSLLPVHAAQLRWATRDHWQHAACAGRI